MRIQNKTFYADLFTKTSAAAGLTPAPELAPELARETARITPMAPLPPALSSKPRQAAREAVKNFVPALPAPAKAATGNETAEATVRGKPSALMELIGDVDIHNLSPRQMTHLSQTLYAAGALSFEDYSRLAFQPELHPDYDRTIGALTGERAAPDQRRDFVTIWDERAAFERRHNAARPDLIEQSERIVSVLRQIEAPMNVMA